MHGALTIHMTATFMGFIEKSKNASVQWLSEERAYAWELYLFEQLEWSLFTLLPSAELY